MNSDKWLLCPICKSKTRLKLLAETELKYYPLYLSKVQAGNSNQC